ncbi:MAG: YggT family protein [Chloroflexota bacterium]
MVAEFLANFLKFLLYALEFAVLGRVLLSWVQPRGQSSLGAFLFMITEPVLGPIRRLLPSSGGFDFSPIIVILVIGTVVRYLP